MQQRPLLPKYDPPSSSASPVLDPASSGSGGEKAASSSSAAAAAKRRCISSACMPCRKRKSKCDGEKPRCGACRDVYRVECRFDIDADHRRKGALKRDISELTERVEGIGAVLDAIRAGSEADVDDIVQLIRSNPDQSHENMAEMIRAMALNKHSDPPPVEPPSSLEGQLLMDFHGKASTDKSGVSSHYGHTSNFSLQDQVQNRAMTAEQVETWTTVTSDTNLINDIMESYFAWIHPIYLIFSEEIFHHGMRDRKPKYCTPLLVNAILALGCHYSDRPETRASPPIGERFFTEAKRLLAEDDNTPALTIVQALGLMSLREAISSHDSSGRRYAAQMMSMAVELGLHISHTAQSGSKLTLSEIEARKVTFWGCFVLEQIWSVCVGRIPTLPRTAVRLEKPTLTASLENTLWRPHGFPEQDVARLTQPSLKYSILLQCSVLVEIVDDILRSFYAPRDRITSRKLQMFHEQLQDWYRKLPPGLAIRKEGPTLPQVITLHIFYNNCIIQTFRPFLKVSFVQGSETPRQICTASANTISQLLDLYKKTYGHRMSVFVNTHCVMSAAIIHLVNICSHPGTSLPETENHLAESIRAMHEMTQKITMAGRYTPIIMELIHKWCKVIPPRVQEAMDEVSIPNLGTPDPTTTNGSTINNHDPKHDHIDLTLLSRKDSAPEIFPTTTDSLKPPLHYQHNFFWTPYPNSFEGVPLALPLQESNHHMDITNVLDSGVSGDWPQWNRDGFTMGGEVWGVDWEGIA
ncbi:uncharacterized protein LY89DRAFT_726432 [Mollisia scopiformis]|uniref:Zn(2)-C6 fungal-type domain-containing protein n=1 Tax=Mollisia scopiformis TaxID=149040 RepID=A0A132B4F9_MOLSC|nr:uncharacterized protein LY89DRAFT_726432 [Mollisia scopiformis]KUJ06547.1 hypothetical protein LY89DRAFT_726432 [Mollisia scopiformis]